MFKAKFLTDVVSEPKFWNWFSEPVKAGANLNRLDAIIVGAIFVAVAYVLYHLYKKNSYRTRRNFK